MIHFFILNLIHYLRSYIKGYHICQLVHNEKSPTRQSQTKIINPNDIQLSRLNTDLKVMPRSYRCHKYILCIRDEVTNYLIIIPIYQARSEQIRDALIENVITKYCIPKYIIMEKNSAVMSSLMNYLFHKFDIKIKTIAPLMQVFLEGINPYILFDQLLHCTLHLGSDCCEI